MSLQFLKDDDIQLNSIKTIEDVKPCENYGTLWQQLKILNSPDINTQRNYSYSPFESYRVKLIKENIAGRQPETFEKELYGIVVEYKHNKGIAPEIYIDVPTKFLQPTNHIDDYIDETTGATVSNICKFYPENDDVTRRIVPVVGSIARVKVPQYFPKNLETNPKANKFLGNVGNNIVYLPPKVFKSGFSKKNKPFTNNKTSGDEQPSPVVNPEDTSHSTVGTPSSMPTNRPKMLLVDFQCDLASRASLGINRGNEYIKIREDISSDLRYVKDILNSYGIPFSCINPGTGLLTQNISDLARVGLEVSINPYSAITKDSQEESDDYYIGPNFNFPLGKYFKLKLYGNIRRNSTKQLKYKPINREISIYNINETYNKKNPKIIKIFRPVIDITQIFEDLGFKQYMPKINFFEKSNNIDSLWNIFYKPVKLSIGYSYKELLETVYYNNNEIIWKEKDKYWNGERFV